MLWLFALMMGRRVVDLWIVQWVKTQVSMQKENCNPNPNRSRNYKPYFANYTIRKLTVCFLLEAVKWSLVILFFFL